MKLDFKKVYCFLSVGILCAVGLWTLFFGNQEFSQMENRFLKKMPVFKISALSSGEFMDRFEEFSSDQFPLRETFISLKAHAERMAGKLESNGVYFAEGGFLIEKPVPFKEETVKRNLEAIISLKENTELPVTVMIVPTAVQILKGKITAPYDDVQLNLTQRAKDALIPEGIAVSDPTDRLMAAEKDELYYKTDHHWTTFGAYLGYLELSQKLDFEPLEYEPVTISDNFYGTTWSKAPFLSQPPDTIERMALTGGENTHIIADGEKTPMYDESALSKKDKYNVFFGGNHAFMEIETEAVSGKSLAVFKDSYAHCLLPFLTAHFKTIYVFDMRYYNKDPIALLEEEGIDEVLILYNAANFASDLNLAKLTA